jgi:hypothetical protein
VVHLLLYEQNAQPLLQQTKERLVHAQTCLYQTLAGPRHSCWGWWALLLQQLAQHQRTRLLESQWQEEGLPG